MRSAFLSWHSARRAVPPFHLSGQPAKTRTHKSCQKKEGKQKGKNSSKAAKESETQKGTGVQAGQGRESATSASASARELVAPKVFSVFNNFQRQLG